MYMIWGILKDLRADTKAHDVVPYGPVQKRKRSFAFPAHFLDWVVFLTIVLYQTSLLTLAKMKFTPFAPGVSTPILEGARYY